MKVNEIRNLTTDEILAKIKESKEELFNLRFQQATGNLDKPSKIKDLRHTVARLKTVLREREIENEKSKQEGIMEKDNTCAPAFR